MRREVTDLIGSGLLLAALLSATFAVLAPTPGAGTAVSSAGSDELYERGRALFYAKGCVGCHTHARAGSTMQIGPNLTSLYARAGTQRPGLSAEAYVRESLLEPNAYYAAQIMDVYMPKFDLREDELRALTAFLLHDER